jgi:hypothetical protein
MFQTKFVDMFVIFPAYNISNKYLTHLDMASHWGCAGILFELEPIASELWSSQ